VPEPAAGEVIELNFGNKGGLEWLPFAHAVTELRTDLARLLSGEAPCLH